MDRTLISWNVPNLITVPLMAILGFLLLGVIVQMAKRAGMARSGEAASTVGGY